MLKLLVVEVQSYFDVFMRDNNSKLWKLGKMAVWLEAVVDWQNILFGQPYTWRCGSKSWCKTCTFPLNAHVCVCYYLLHLQNREWNLTFCKMHNLMVVCWWVFSDNLWYFNSRSNKPFCQYCRVDKELLYLRTSPSEIAEWYCRMHGFTCTTIWPICWGSSNVRRAPWTLFRCIFSSLWLFFNSSVLSASTRGKNQ